MGLTQIGAESDFAEFGGNAGTLDCLFGLTAKGDQDQPHRRSLALVDQPRDCPGASVVEV